VVVAADTPAAVAITAGKKSIFPQPLRLS